MQPNILLILTDQHRPDAIGCAGDRVVQTPNLDRMAREGVRFSRAYCQGPLCMPARASLVTERYVRDHGVSGNSSSLGPRAWPTFIQAVQAAGYRTGCIGKMHLYNHARGLHTTAQAGKLRAFGFDESVEGVGKVASTGMGSPYSDALEARGLLGPYQEWLATRVPRGRAEEVVGRAVAGEPMWYTDSFPFAPDAYLDSWIGGRAVEWAETYDRPEPFFQWIGFAGPHNPWDAPKAYVDRYRDAEIPLNDSQLAEMPPEGPFRRFMEGRFRHSETEGLTPEVVREIRRFYYANLTLIDEQIGRLLATLERRGILEHTWVIYTTDHGEMLGDHGLLTKTVFYEPSAGVPLIIRPPSGMQGRVVDGLVQHVDVSATIRAIALPASEGRSLLGHTTEDGAGFTREVAFSENLGFGMAVTKQYKLVVHEESRVPVQLFDLVADPGEDRNIVADDARAGLREEMMQRYMLPFLDRAPIQTSA